MSWIVPRDERRDWRSEWSGELAALRRSGASPARRLGFALGAVPHALSIRWAGATGRGATSDLRFALRTLVRRPGFAAIAALTLALGIAVNGALFSLVDGLLVRSLPGVVEPESLVQIARSYDSAPRWDNFSYPAVEFLGEAEELFEGVAGYAGRVFLIGQGADAELVAGEYVTGTYFDVLRARPTLGRLLQPSDDRAGAEPVVVLAHGLWTRRFGADPGVVERMLAIGGIRHRVVGVAPEGFVGVDKLGAAPGVFVPATLYPPFSRGGPPPWTEWDMSWLDIVGRLRSGVMAEAANAGLDGWTMALREARPQYGDIRIVMEPGIGLAPAERAEASRLALLMAVVAGLVLLLTAANVAGLFLARAVDRKSEFALRRTLGAGGGRIARQLLTESVLLAGVAAVLAAPLLHWTNRGLSDLVPGTVAIGFDPDLRLYLALLVAALGAGLAFGGMPAWVAARQAPGRGLGTPRTATGSAAASRLRNGLVVGQLAISLGLVAGAGLLLRSVSAGLGARPGLDPSSVFAASLDLALTGRYDAEGDKLRFTDRLLRDLRGDPRVAEASASSTAPFWGPFARMSQRPPGGGDDNVVEADIVFADRSWFELYGVDFRGGAGFGEDGSEPVALVNESMERRFWPGGAVGQYLAGSPDVRIVGVVPDARLRSLRSSPTPAVFRPLAEAFSGRIVVQLRPQSGVAPDEVGALLREHVAAIDPGLPVASVIDVQEQMALTLGETRRLGTVVAVFAVLALLLAGIGLYAIVAYAVARRTREMAVRAAIGAEPSALFRQVVRGGSILIGVGLLLGLGVAWGLGRALAGTLYGVSHFDPTTLLLCVVLQGAFALAAVAIPARRAVRIDPARALREEM